MKRILACLAIGLALLFAMPAMADIIIGNPPDPGVGNCFPFGCAYNAEYQQVYTSSNFNGPITIGGLEFYNTQYNSSSTQLPTGTFTISLSTTQADVNSITGNFAGNLGSDNTQVFSGSINQAWEFGNTLHISLSQAFTYDPAKGNLLVDVLGTDASTPGGQTFFDVNSNGYFARVYCEDGVACDTGSVDGAYGVVTGFDEVPEPGTLLLMGAGLLGTLGAVRRRM